MDLSLSINSGDCCCGCCSSQCPTISDDFNRADGPLGSTPVGNRTWITTGIEIEIVGNGVGATSGVSGAAIIAAGNVDQGVQIRVLSATPTTILVGGELNLFAGGSGAFIVCTVGFAADLTNADLSQHTFGPVIAVGDVVRVEIAGDTAEGFVNGVSFGTVTGATGSGTGTSWGFGFTSIAGGPYIDDFEISCILSPLSPGIQDSAGLLILDSGGLPIEGS